MPPSSSHMLSALRHALYRVRRCAGPTCTSMTSKPSAWPSSLARRGRSQAEILRQAVAAYRDAILDALASEPGTLPAPRRPRSTTSSDSASAWPPAVRSSATWRPDASPSRASSVAATPPSSTSKPLQRPQPQPRRLRSDHPGCPLRHQMARSKVWLDEQVSQRTAPGPARMPPLTRPAARSGARARHAATRPPSRGRRRCARGRCGVRSCAAGARALRGTPDARLPRAG